MKEVTKADIEKMRVALGLKPFGSVPGCVVNGIRRGSGKTTERLVYAITHAMAGNCVLFVAHSQRYANDLADRVWDMLYAGHPEMFGWKRKGRDRFCNQDGKLVLLFKSAQNDLTQTTRGGWMDKYVEDHHHVAVERGRLHAEDFERRMAREREEYDGKPK